MQYVKKQYDSVMVHCVCNGYRGAFSCVGAVLFYRLPTVLDFYDFSHWKQSRMGGKTTFGVTLWSWELSVYAVRILKGELDLRDCVFVKRGHGCIGGIKTGFR